MENKLKGYADIQHLSEDDRIKVIGKYIKEHPNEIVGIAIEAISKNKVKRYIKKLLLNHPHIAIIETKTSTVLTTIKIRHRIQNDKGA